MLLYFVHVNVFLFISLCYILNKAGRIFFGDGESWLFVSIRSLVLIFVICGFSSVIYMQNHIIF